MNIFVIPAAYPTEDKKVANLFIYEKVKALKNSGHNIVILHVEQMPTRSILKKFDSDIRIKNDEEGLRYTVRQKTFMEKSFLSSARKHFVRDVERLYLKAVSDNGEPDIIYAHFSCWAGYAAAYLKEKYKIKTPLVIEEHHSVFMQDNVPDFYIDTISYSLKYCDKMLAVSAGLRDNIKKITKTDKDISIIPNIVSDIYFTAEKEKHFGKAFVTVGRLDNKVKRFDMIIDSFYDAFYNVNDVSLYIIGDGKDRDVLKKMISDYKMEDRIIMTGFLVPEKVASYFQKSDVFVLPSPSETFGVVFREALASGLPVITADNGGISDDWSDKYGLMLKQNSRDELSSALKYLYNSYMDYNSTDISNSMKERYSTESITNKLNEIFLPLIN